MSAHATASNTTSPAPRWRLWVDGCGGFLLLGGTSWTIGGLSHPAQADICVRADWPRVAGTLLSKGGDYFWQSSRPDQRRVLMISGKSLPVSGTAVVTFAKPSPLCETAVLRLKPPHRFDEHVDAVVVGGETILVGPGPDCHIRCRDATERAILTLREGNWLVKKADGEQFEPLQPGSRLTLEQLAITLEEA